MALPLCLGRNPSSSLWRLPGRPQPLPPLHFPGSLQVLKCSRHSPASGPLQVLFPLVLSHPFLSSSQGWPFLSISSSTRRPFLITHSDHPPSKPKLPLPCLTPLEERVLCERGRGPPWLGQSFLSGAWHTAGPHRANA